MSAIIPGEKEKPITSRLVLRWLDKATLEIVKLFQAFKAKLREWTVTAHKKCGIPWEYVEANKGHFESKREKQKEEQLFRLRGYIQ